MKNKKRNKQKEAEEELLKSEAIKHAAKPQDATEDMLKSEAKKHAAKPRPPLYNQIDSHKWASKMEVFRLLSS